MAESKQSESRNEAPLHSIVLGTFGNLFSAPWAQAFGVGALTFVLWLQPGISTSPVFWDNAYFTYLEQSILLGESIYATSFMGYPPLGLMIPAGAMWVGQWFDLPTYLAPRYLAVPLGAVCVMLIYDVVRRATGSWWTAVLAAVSLAATKRLSTSVLITLEPKVLVIFFCLLACAAVQRRRWWAVGLFGGLSASCWQPAALIPLTLGAVALWNERADAKRTFMQLCAGSLLAIIPSAVYLTQSNAWHDYWIRGVVLPYTAQSSGMGTEPLHWVRVAMDQFSSDVLFFAAALAGFSIYAIERLRKTDDSSASWMSSTMGGLPPLTLGWVLFNSLEFQNNDDMFPFFPCIAFWVAWCAHRVGVFGVAMLGNLGFLRVHVALLARAGLVALLVGTSYYVARDRVMINAGITLAEEIAIINRIIEPAGSDGTVMGFTTEAVFALSERRSPTPYLRLTDAFMPFLPLVEPGGCQGLLERIRRSRPEVVVVDIWKHSSPCEQNLPDELAKINYVGREEHLAIYQWFVYVSDSPAPIAAPSEESLIR